MRSPAQLTFNDILNVPIETPAVSWNYALVLPLDVPMPDSTLTIEVGVEVIEGKLGIVGYGEDSSRFCAPERALVAMPEPQRVVIKVQGKDIRYLVFRSVALDGTRTLFKVTSIEARTSVPGLTTKSAARRGLRFVVN